MITLENVSMVYPVRGGQVRALDDVSLQVPRGGFVAVIGPSGSGKTTLMNIIGCLDLPTQGRYLLEGRPVLSVSDSRAAYARNRQLGFIFQSFNLVPTMSAAENVELPLVIRGVGARTRRGIAREALRMVGLEDRAGHRPGQLSGGQQQRVAIARVLAGDPKVILADEPTGNLDSRAGREVIATICALNDMGKTVVMITHDMAVAAAAKRVIKMHNGKTEEIKGV